MEMRKKLFATEIAGFIFVSITGTLCHFAYEWSGFNIAVGLFCPVNESVWEHLKLLYFPYLLWGIIQCFKYKDCKQILSCKCIGAICAMMTITGFFYTYSGIIGKTIDALNILSFFIGVLAGFAIDYTLIKSVKFDSTKSLIASIIVFLILCAIFFLFTIYPPIIPLFRDPLSLSYGI